MTTSSIVSVSVEVPSFPAGSKTVAVTVWGPSASAADWMFQVPSSWTSAVSWVASTLTPNERARRCVARACDRRGRVVRRQRPAGTERDDRRQGVDRQLLGRGRGVSGAVGRRGRDRVGPVDDHRRGDRPGAARRRRRERLAIDRDGDDRRGGLIGRAADRRSGRSRVRARTTCDRDGGRAGVHVVVVEGERAAEREDACGSRSCRLRPPPRHARSSCRRTSQSRRPRPRRRPARTRARPARRR